MRNHRAHAYLEREGLLSQLIYEHPTLSCKNSLTLCFLYPPPLLHGDCQQLEAFTRGW